MPKQVAEKVERKVDHLVVVLAVQRENLSVEYLAGLLGSLVAKKAAR